MPDLIPAEVPGEPGHTCRITQRGLEVYVQNIGNVDAPSSRVYVRYSGGFGVAEHLSQHYTGVSRPARRRTWRCPSRRSFPHRSTSPSTTTTTYGSSTKTTTTRPTTARSSGLGAPRPCPC